MDDWSIIRTAQVLSQTGQVRFNGWESPTLGWLPFLGAAAIRLFGFSFTVVREAQVGVSAVFIFLLQRLFVRVGISEWNGAIGATTMAFSPIFLVSAMTFMTDVPSTLAIVVCLYGCVRAVQAESQSRGMVWISFASLANAFLGSVRQTSWLGLFVMVPCALWLIRRQRKVLAAGVVTGLMGLASVAIVLHWFKHQPYVLPVELFPGKLAPYDFLKAAWITVRIGLELVLVILPVPLVFLTVVRPAGFRKNRSVLVLAALMTIGLLAILRFRSGHFLAPFLPFGAFQQTLASIITDFPLPILGPAPAPLTITFRFICTLLILLAVFALLYLQREHKSLQRPVDRAALVLSWNDLFVLVVPFSLAYLAILLPRAVSLYAVDRYLLPLMPIALLLLIRLHQRFMAPRLPRFTFILLALFAGYSVATLHDAFAVYRANLLVISELRAAGVPRTAIGGGFEYNLYTELLENGYVPYPGIRLPDGSLQPPAGNTLAGGFCEDLYLFMTPAVHPLFSVSYPESGCRKADGFTPIHFTTWLLPHDHVAEAVKTQSAPPLQALSSVK